MTGVTPVGTGATVAGDNATLAPPLPAALVVGDLLVAFAAIRNTVATVATPAGWTPLINGGNVLVVARYYQAGDAAPSFTFSGGAAGDTTQAACSAWRTASLAVRDGPFSIANAAAANVAIPAVYTPSRNGSLSFAFAWKQAAWTSVAALTGMTEAVDAPSATGLGQSIAMDWRADGSSVALPAGPFVVTGGVAAISAGYTITLDRLAFITVTPQDAYPPRNLISVTNLVIGDSVTVYRVVSGQRTALRAGASAAVADPSFLVVDAELPFGAPVSYVAVVVGVEYATAATTYTLPGGKVALSDAIGGQAAEVTIRAWPEKAYGRQSTTFRAGGRNVVVSGDLVGAESAVELYVETTSSRDNVMALVVDATEGTVQLRQSGAYDGVDSYLAVREVRERRFSQDGSDERRLMMLDVAEVEPWAPTLQARGFTYADLEALYVGLTYANLASAYATYLALAQADLSP